MDSGFEITVTRIQHKPPTYVVARSTYFRTVDIQHELVVLSIGIVPYTFRWVDVD